MSKSEAQLFDGEIFNVRDLIELTFSKLYQIETVNRSAALENLCDDLDINRT